MRKQDLDLEIDKLKLRKMELTNRINIVKDFDEKEELEGQIKRIDGQIQVLEKFRIRT